MYYIDVLCKSVESTLIKLCDGFETPKDSHIYN